MFCFAKYETYETVFRMLKPVSRNPKFCETSNIFNFSRNTKLVSHEILENCVRKKLECQPYVTHPHLVDLQTGRAAFVTCILAEAYTLKSAKFRVFTPSHSPNSPPYSLYG